MPATSTLGGLHWVIQILYGWAGRHMHDFKVGNKRYSVAIYGLEDAADEEELRLPQAFGPGVRKITYTYDFGAWWKHEITLERQLPRQVGKV
jgi:Plasmid pRiA4b ORF-3-like protein